MVNTQKENFLATNFYKFLVVFFVLLLAGCGSGGGGGDAAPPSDTSPTNVVLTSGLAPNASLSYGGETDITAYITDISDQPVVDGTTIYFSVNNVEANIEATATTTNGFAIANLQARTATGDITITASTETDIKTGVSISNALDISIVTPTDPADKIVLTNGLAPGAYLLTGGETDMTAYVTDSVGLPVLDGTIIYFSVNNTGSIIEATATTTSGVAIAVLRAGSTTGTITVTAATETNIQTGTSISSTADITIVSQQPPFNPPDNIVLTNGLIPGDYLLPGNETLVTAYVTDTTGHPVIDGTTIYFSVSNSDVSIDPLATTNNGIATVNLQAGTATGNITVTAATAINIQTGSSVTNTVDVPIVSPPTTMVLTNGLPPGTSLSPGGTTTVTAFVVDAADRPVIDGTTIYFSTLGFGAAVDPSATTVNGFASATFTAETVTGSIPVTAATEVDPQTGNNITSTVNIQVLDNNAAAISFVSVSPESFISIKGSGQNEFAEILFQVKNSDGNPVLDGTPINFTLTLSLHGGERLLEDNAFTIGGEVVARVQSGYVAGPLRVVASYTNENSGEIISTQGVVAVVSGPADLEHLTLSQDLFNQAGFVYEGLLNEFHTVLADRYGNIVKDGTPVSYISDCGRIGVNALGVDDLGSFELTTIDGKATAEFRTSNPVKPVCTIVAYTPGQESFDDLNANGIYDVGSDICTADIGEPYIDENLDGEHTLGEIYIDTNQNGQYDVANGECETNTLIWGSASLTMSSYIADQGLELYDAVNKEWVDAPSVVELTKGESKKLRFKVEDSFGSRLVQGTVITVDDDLETNTTQSGTIITCSNFNFIGPNYTKLDDRSGPGDILEFVIQDASPEFSSPQTCQLYIKIESTTDMTTTGNNGSEVLSSFVVNYGQLTNSDDETPPIVIQTVPTADATQVLAEDTITIVFDEPMNPLTVLPEAITLVDLTEGSQRTTYVNMDDSTATSFAFTPDGGFTAGHEYEVTVSTAVEDLAGNKLEGEYIFSFTSIGALVDPPRVVFTSPGQGAVNVRKDASIVIQFSQKMDITTVTTDNISLEILGGAPVDLVLTSVSTDGTTFVFDMSSVNLEPNTSYKVTVNANVRDSVLIPMDKDFTSVFTTGSL